MTTTFRHFVSFSSKTKSFGDYIWDMPHAALPTTRHEWTRPCLNCSQTGWNPIYLSLKDRRLSWPWCWLYTEMVYPSAVIHLGSTNRESNSWPHDSKSNVMTVMPPRYMVRYKCRLLTYLLTPHSLN